MKPFAVGNSFAVVILFAALSVTACSNDADAPESTGDQTAAPKTDSSQSETPSPKDLMTASLNGDLERVRQSLERGVDVNSTDEKGTTPLMLAAYNGHTQVVRQLLEHGARVDARNAEGRTALMFAATGSFPETVEVLLDRGADPNARDQKEEWSALMFASAEGRVDVVQMLLDNGADPSFTDTDGDTALTFAKDNGHTEVVRLLEEARERS